MKKLVLFVIFITMRPVLWAVVTLPHVFSDHMVLQRNIPIIIWGWAEAGERVAIHLHEQSGSVKADKAGNWLITLKPEEAGGPYEMTVTSNGSGKNSGIHSVVLKDILIGEVWICSGQSNMEFSLKGVMNAAEEIRTAACPMIRELRVAKNTSFRPLKDIQASSWQVCAPETAGNFTAVGYFFARKLWETLNVPIGLIHTSWGGTNVETWTSREALRTDSDFTRLTGNGPESFAGIRRSKILNTLETITKFQHGDIAAGDTVHWKDQDYDDSNWPHLSAPGFWEPQGLPDLDGVVWYRKEIVLTAEQAKQGALLELAMIDDADETYVNGVRVGSTSNYLALRKYRVPPGVLKEGKNVIAIRVTDTAAGGGIHGDAATLQLTVDGQFPLSLAGEWRVKVDTANILFKGTEGPNAYPSLLFNAMLSPLIPYGIRGAIWYQGEANGDRGHQYERTFPLMIRDWRNRWKEGDFPFYFVQLSSYNASGQNGLTGSQWAELRDAQRKTLSLPNTGMAVTIDIGDPKNIHPVNKQDVGLRLALNALHKTYGLPVTPDGPIYTSVEFKGKEAFLTFSDLSSGWMIKDKYGYIRGFQIAGKDHLFKWGKAYLSGNRIVVYNDEVAEPVAVRYGWTDDAGEADLFNKEGLPASPFRTDNWKGLTAGNRYVLIY
ncbi:sialate O-acetylesterase [Flavitalea flava]